MSVYRAILIALAIVFISISATAAPICSPLPDEKIGIQMFSMNSMLRGATPATVESVLTGLHNIGYKNAELAGLMGQSIPTLRPIIEKTQIKVVGNHGPFTADLTAWDKTIADAQALGQTPMIGSAGYGPPGLNGGIDNVLATAANLNKLGAAAAAKGYSLYMHNHTAEITSVYSYDIKKNGKPEMVSALEIVAANTDPRYVHFEIDIHWALEAYKNNQDDMIAFLNRLKGRIIALHVKDTAPDGKITDVGKGVIDWSRVYAAAGPDVKYYIWEYDGAPDPMKNAEIAYKYMRCIN